MSDQQKAIQGAVSALAAAREMLGVFEDNGGHDGLRGEGYRATLDQIDEASKGLRAIAAAAAPRADEMRAQDWRSPRGWRLMALLEQATSVARENWPVMADDLAAACNFFRGSPSAAAPRDRPDAPREPPEYEKLLAELEQEKAAHANATEHMGAAFAREKALRRPLERLIEVAQRQWDEKSAKASDLSRINDAREALNTSLMLSPPTEDEAAAASLGAPVARLDDLREAIQWIDAIRIRCREGDPKSNWLPKIAEFADTAISLLEKQSPAPAASLEVEALDAEWMAAIDSWRKCSSKRLSWASGSHCSACGPLQRLTERGARAVLQKAGRHD